MAGGESALALLETLVLLVDDEPLAFANDDLAILGASLDAAADFHGGFFGRFDVWTFRLSY
jgi:hypothetical protein